MFTYLATIPAAAVKREIDGNLYAHSNLELSVLPDGRVTIKTVDKTKMLRVHSVHPTNGTANLILGRAGEAIANTTNLPFGVDAVQDTSEEYARLFWETRIP